MTPACPNGCSTPSFNLPHTPVPWQGPRPTATQKVLRLKRNRKRKLLQATICELTYLQFASQIGLGHVNSFASLSQTAKFFNAFELFAYCLMTSTAYWQRRLPDNHNNKLGNLANLTIFHEIFI